MKLYNRLATFYDLLYAYRDYSGEANFLVSKVQGIASAAILDVACGTGNHLREVRRRLPAARLTGVDLSEDMLDVAKTKCLDARLERADMRSLNLGEQYDLVYCLASSIQYCLTSEEFVTTVKILLSHVAPTGKMVFDLAFSTDGWREGYTNITCGVDDNYEVVEMYTTRSAGKMSLWNPVYFVKDRHCGTVDMHVDAHCIRLWNATEVEELLISENVDYQLEWGFGEERDSASVAVFILERSKVD